MQNKTMNKLYLSISILAFLLIVVFKPFDLDLNKSIILGTVVMSLIWWGTNCVPKSISSVLVLVLFFIFSTSDIQTILRFPLSNNIILIVSSYFIANGIKVSGLAERVSKFVISKYARNGFKLIALNFVLSFILIFMIPQTFPRAIILTLIIKEFLDKQDINSKNKSIIIFSVFVAVTATSMAFINGDIIFNNAAMQFAGLKLTWIEWATYMTIPTILISILMFLAFIILFRNGIKDQVFVKEKVEKKALNILEIKGIIITVIIISLWSTESIHGISAAIVSLFGVIIMLFMGLVKITDYMIIKLELLLFLTAAFSIGGVLNHEGIAQVIFERVFPSYNGDSTLILLIIIVVMILHMIIGSSMTTMSISMPVIIASLPNYVNSTAIMLIVYIAINTHYVLPIHHVVIMIGEGDGHYDSKMILRYGLLLTILVFISIYMIVLPYWKMIGIM